MLVGKTPAESESPEMSRQCPKCTSGTLIITGMGYYSDTIIVECNQCNHFAELEPDGLGEGGMEMVEAYEIENRRNSDD
jgi:hypothetical protein